MFQALRPACPADGGPPPTCGRSPTALAPTPNHIQVILGISATATEICRNGRSRDPALLCSYNRRVSEAPLSPAEKLHLALDLFDSGVDLMRQNLRRRHPKDPDAEIEARIVRWLRTRPGAEHGDAVGRPRTLGEPAA